MAEQKLEVEVERLKAQVEALLKAREAMSERIVGLSERIGELRSSLFEHERSGATLEAEMKRAIELVNQIKPEEILKEVKKFDAKLEVTKARIESYESLIDRVVEEMKEMRRTFVQFRSLETIAKMAEDFEKSLKEAKKVESAMRGSASKVESMFREVEKRYKELVGLIKVSEELKERFKLLLSEFDKLRIEFVGVAKKEDVENIAKRVEVGLKESEELNKELKQRREELKEIVLSSKEMAKVSERVAALIEERKDIQEKLSILDNLVDSFHALSSSLEKLDSRLTILEEFKERALTKAELSFLTKKIDRKILEMGRFANELREKINRWERTITPIVKASELVLQTAKKMKYYEKALASFEKRQRSLMELLEAMI